MSALGAVYSLLHYSVGSPRLAISQPAALWCPDFPLARDTRERSMSNVVLYLIAVTKDGCKTLNTEYRAQVVCAPAIIQLTLLQDRYYHKDISYR